MDALMAQIFPQDKAEEHVESVKDRPEMNALLQMLTTSRDSTKKRKDLTVDLCQFSAALYHLYTKMEERERLIDLLSATPIKSKKPQASPTKPKNPQSTLTKAKKKTPAAAPAAAPAPPAQQPTVGDTTVTRAPATPPVPAAAKAPTPQTAPETSHAKKRPAPDTDEDDDDDGGDGDEGGDNDEGESSGDNDESSGDESDAVDPSKSGTSGLPMPMHRAPAGAPVAQKRARTMQDPDKIKVTVLADGSQVRSCGCKGDRGRHRSSCPISRK